MRPLRHSLLLALGLPALLMAPSLGQAQQVYALDPPADIAGLLARLRGAEGWAAATRALAERDDAAPYLRKELATARDPLHKRNLREALEAIEGRIRDRNRVRFAGWAKNRRLDLCNELIVACSDRKEAVEMVDRLLPVLHKIGAEAADQLDLPFGSQPGIYLPEPFNGRRGGFLHLAEEEVTVRRNGDAFYPTIIRAEQCEVGLNNMFGWFVAVRSEIRHPPSELLLHQWDCSIVLVNNAVPLKSATSSVIVCDGDVELLGSVSNSVVIANGSMRAAAKGQWPPIRRSILYAAGDIVYPGPGPGRRSPDPSRFHAGGSVKFGGKGEYDDRVRGKMAEPPFGVRFLDPREFGVELAAEAGGLRVAKLTDWSPFAKHGIREGDVITKTNEVVTDSVPAFSREFRRSIILESVVLQLRRGDDRLARIVFLDGIPPDPAQTAPPPREVGR